MKYLSLMAEKRLKGRESVVGMRHANESGMSKRTQRQTDADVARLLLAVHRGSEDEVKRLLAQGVDVNGADADGMTPLMASAMKGHTAVSRLLLESGADCGLLNAWGLTARDIAAWHGYDALAELLDRAAASARRCGRRTRAKA